MHLALKVNVGHDLQCQEQLSYVVGNYIFNESKYIDTFIY